MRVNGRKTAMICVFAAKSYTAKSHVFGADGDIVESGDTMKVLVYHLFPRLGACAQV